MPSYRRTQVSKWARGSSGNHLSPRAEKSLTAIRDGTGLLLLGINILLFSRWDPCKGIRWVVCPSTRGELGFSIQVYILQMGNNSPRSYWLVRLRLLITIRWEWTNRFPVRGRSKCTSLRIILGNTSSSSVTAVGQPSILSLLKVGLIEDRARVVRSLGPICYSARPGKQFPPSTSITKLIGDWFRLQIYFADRAWRLNKQSKLLAGVIAVLDVSPEPVPEHHDL